MVMKNIAATHIKSMSALSTRVRKLSTFHPVPVSLIRAVQNGEKVATGTLNSGLAIPQAVVASPAYTVLSIVK